MEVILRFAHVNPWAGIAKYKNCFDTISPYLTRSGNRYTGLTEEQARELEKKLEYPEGHLSPSSEFWKTYGIRLGAKELHLFTERPTDELAYFFLKNHKRVSNGITNLRPGHDYILVNMEEDAQEINRKARTKRKAMSEFDKMTIEDMRKCLRLYGRKTTNITNEVIESNLSQDIEKDPDKFLNIWVNNKNRQTQFLIEEAISKNVIRRNKNIYYYGTDIIGHGMDDVIITLDDKKNQEMKMAILDMINSK